MTRRRPRVSFALLTAMSLVLVLVSCGDDDPRLQSMRNLEPEPPTEDRVQELKRTIAEYEDLVAEAIEAAIREADALKLLGQEYMRQELYGPAFDAYSEAIRIEPRNQVLHYLAAVAAGLVGKAQARPDARAEYLRLAERSYLQAVEIAPNYLDARYGLGVLYVFELGEPVKALPHLERALEISENHAPALFVLARAHVALGNVEEAVDAYDRIIRAAPGDEMRRRAERNRQLILGGES
ncbi:MAG: tetratricopeptide repeat protein [Spirochaetota bacterium]